MNSIEHLKRRHADKWAEATQHRFIAQLGDGTLDRAVFREYFIQDYVFVNDLARFSALAIAKSPGLAEARPIHAFLSNLLGAEDALFQTAFDQLNVDPAEYRAATANEVIREFSEYLMRVGYEGTWTEICTVLAVTEGVYLEWGQRLASEGADPGDELYQGWIDLHTEAVLGEFVTFLNGQVGEMNEKIESAFLTALEFEIDFWNASYAGGESS
jgi:thiaminase/transcriptional activator TenA